MREELLQQFVFSAISYLRSSHRKNEQSVTPLTSEVRHGPTQADADVASDPFPDVWQLSLRLLSQRKRVLHVLSHFPDIFPAPSALNMPEMFTGVMKVGTLHFCYKQIFPLPATVVNGLRTSTSPRPSAEKFGI